MILKIKIKKEKRNLENFLSSYGIDRSFKTNLCYAEDSKNHYFWFTATAEIMPLPVHLPNMEVELSGHSDYADQTENTPSAIPLDLLNLIRNPFNTIDAIDLLKKDFPQINWRVQGLYGSGLNNLNATPKSGKSLYALQLALSVSAGLPFLGLDTVKSKVLFLALEDGQRRIKDRLTRYSDMAIVKGDIFITTEWPRGLSGIEQIENFIKYQNPGLIVIDTWGRFAGVENGNDYSEVTEVAGALQHIAHTHDVCIFAIHHTKKKAEDDYLLNSLGSTAFAAVADSVSNLSRARGETSGKLQVTGRDIEEKEILLNLDLKRLRWNNVNSIAPEKLKTVFDETQGKLPIKNENLSFSNRKKQGAAQ